jgi:hypothetical protein
LQPGKEKFLHRKKYIAVLSFIVCLLPLDALSYSVLTHEALIDANWDKVLLPLLKHKFPAANTDALKEAHAYAYGGAVVPDMGYYPSGSKLFTSLLHYVRSGNFTEHLLEEATNANEYAFALGVLCHYNADRYGHSIGINTSVPLIYPEMKEHYGDTVTWADDHISHMRTEFSFDVLQTARGAYASAAYQDFIGFKVADTVLEKAFYKTYGLHLNDIFRNLSRTISIFRWTTGNLLPFITRTAWSAKKQQIQDSVPGTTARNFIYRMKVRNYNKQFDKRARPGFVAYVAAGIIKILPKIGPLRVLRFRQPIADAEKKFVQSFDSTSAHFAAIVKTLSSKDVDLANIDFDTGNKTMAGEYEPADIAYQQWLLKLKENNFATTDAAMQKNILAFFNSYDPPLQTTKEKKLWKNTTVALLELRQHH